MEKFSNKSFILKIYTNKGKSLFCKASSNIIKNYSKDEIITILYDDYDVDNKLIKNLDNFFYVSPRKITSCMDDKICFSEKMSNSKYVPKHYKDINKLKDDRMYYVKLAGSTSCKGVHLLRKEDIDKNYLTNSIIQENILEPDLYKKRRYKIRTYLFIFQGKCYLNKNFFAYIATSDYIEKRNIPQKEIDKMNIIYNGECINGDVLEKKDLILKNIKNSCSDFRNRYKQEIEKINSNQYTILGFDYVVQKDKSVYIIEINHRPNFYHTEKISKEVDIPVLEDVLKVLIENKITNTDFILIN